MLSRDGKRVAVAHDLRSDESHVVILSTDAATPPVFIADGTLRYADQLAFNPSGDLLAVGLAFEEGSAVVRVHRSTDGSVVAERDVGARAIAWLDEETLLLGGEALSAWSW